MLGKILGLSLRVLEPETFYIGTLVIERVQRCYTGTTCQKDFKHTID